MAHLETRERHLVRTDSGRVGPPVFVGSRDPCSDNHYQSQLGIGDFRRSERGPMSNQKSAQFVVMRVARTVVLLPLLLFPMLASAQAQSTATAAQVAGANAKTNPTGTPPILRAKAVVGRWLGP